MDKPKCKWPGILLRALVVVTFPVWVVPALIVMLFMIGAEDLLNDLSPVWRWVRYGKED